MDQNTSTAHDSRCENADSLYDLCRPCLATYAEWVAEREAEAEAAG